MRSDRTLIVSGILCSALSVWTVASIGAPTEPQLQPAMGEPLAELSSDELARYIAGRQAFLMPVLPEQGGGPIMNESGCAMCHNNPVGGPGENNVIHFGRVANGVFDPMLEQGGTLWQRFSLYDCPEVIPNQANVLFSRITPGALGFGLIEAIPDSDLLALAANPPSPEVSGRAHMVAALEDPPGAPMRVGKFGFKSTVATMLSFSANAARNEMGLTNRLMPTEPPPNGNVEILETCDPVADPEDNVALGGGAEFIDRVTDFQRFLAAPPQTPRSGMTGEAMFHDIGCTACHAPAFTTAADPTLEPALRNRVIHPYSDFLLHDMGTLADFPEGDASAAEFRTTPLWGLRTRTRLLHDGRVGEAPFEVMIENAVKWHQTPGSEASFAADAFFALSRAQRQPLIAFLDSLGRREFDHDGDGIVSEADLDAFAGCYGGVGFTADDSCAISDLDRDGDVDVADLAGFVTVYDGPQEDCNANGAGDLMDIAGGFSSDNNLDLIPDECDSPCSGDLNADGAVDVIDLLQLMSSWGPCPGCAADLTGDGVVDVADLLALLGMWGPCGEGRNGES